jgi:hypothetical protein
MPAHLSSGPYWATTAGSGGVISMAADPVSPPSNVNMIVYNYITGHFFYWDQANLVWVAFIT